MAGILFLSNVKFDDASIDGGEGSKAANMDVLDRAAKLFGLPNGKLLHDALTFKKLTVGRDVTMAPQNAARAELTKNVLAKLFYGKLFNGAIKKLNETLLVEDASTAGGGRAAGSTGGSMRKIGLLDIAGFECFDFNTWEQLCINLSNECLQQHFNEYVFQKELEDYKAEGVTIQEITYADNTDILELIQGKQGSLFAMLDNELSVPKATDKTYVNKISKDHAAHARFFPDKASDSMEFTLQHFAGKVRYNTEGWLARNLDQPPPEAVGLMLDSQNCWLQRIGKLLSEDAADAGSGPARGAKKKKTVASQFKASLSLLMENIRSAEPHFIRCIKPNSDKVANKFVPTMVFEQLTYSGALEAVKIRQAGYPLRMPFKEFIARYRAVIPKSMQKQIVGKTGKPLDSKESMGQIAELLPKILDSYYVKPSDFAVGISKIFLKASANRAIDQSRRFAYAGCALVIQKFYRGMAARKAVKLARECMQQIQQFLKKHAFYVVENANGTSYFKGNLDAFQRDAIDVANKLADKSQRATPVPPVIGKFEEFIGKMEQELALYRKKDELVKSMDVTELDKAIGVLKKLKITDEFLKVLKWRSEQMGAQVALLNALKTLDLSVSDIDIDDAPTTTHYKQVLDAVKEAQLTDDPKMWVDPAGATMYKKAIDLYADVSSRHGKRLSEQEEARKIKEAEKARYEAEVAEKRRKEAEEELAAAKAKDDSAAIEKAKKSVRRATQVRKKTIAGMEVDAQEALLKKLDQAALEYDQSALKDLLERAVEAGIDGATLQELRETYKNLYDDEFVKENLKISIENLTKKNDMKESERKFFIRRTNNLIKVAKLMNIDETLISDISALLRRVIERSAAQNGRRGTMFQNGATKADLENAMDTYGDLTTCPILNPTCLKKRRLDSGKLVRPYEDGGNLSWSKHKIAAPLTRLPESAVPGALSVYRNILGWMNDRPVPENKRAPLAYAIVFKGKGEDVLKNEIFVQLMKQLTNNPTQRSELLGWKLMSFLCQYVQPGPELVEYLRAFVLRMKLKSRGNPDYAEICNIATQCYHHLEEMQVDSNTTAAQRDSRGR